MSPRSKLLRLTLLVVPLVLVALLWRAASHRPRFVATPVSAQALALSGDGKRVAFSIQSLHVLWIEDGQLHKLPTTQAYPGYPPFGSPPAVQFAPDGDAVFRIEHDIPQVFRWNLATDGVAWSAIPPVKTTQPLGDFAVSRDGKRLAQRVHGVVKVLDISKPGTPQKPVPGNGASQYARRFPVLFRQEIGVKARRGSDGYVAALALSSDGAVLIAAEPSGSLQFWNVASGQLTRQTAPLPSISGSITQLKPSPDGRFVAFCDDKGVALWSTQTGKWTRAVATTLVALHDLAWMPDSRSLWTSSFVIPNADYDRVQRLRVPDLKPLRVVSAWGPIAVSGDGKTLATRDNAEKGVWLWNIE